LVLELELVWELESVSVSAWESVSVSAWELELVRERLRFE
jgi:hypothetical protein